MDSSDAAAPPPAPAPAKPPPRKLSMLQKLERRARSDPLVFSFLGLTVAALGGGMWSLLRDNKAQSQLMMRARVGFQFSAVMALVGGIYYREYQATSAVPSRAAQPLSAAAFEAKAASAAAGTIQ
jgi:hypothetical protein